MLGPFHQDQQLLLHTLPNVWDVGQSLCADVVICQLVANFIPVIALRRLRVSSDNTCKHLCTLPVAKTPPHSAKSWQRGHYGRSWCPPSLVFSCWSCPSRSGRRPSSSPPWNISSGGSSDIGSACPCPLCSSERTYNCKRASFEHSSGKILCSHRKKQLRSVFLLHDRRIWRSLLEWSHFVYDDCCTLLYPEEECESAFKNHLLRLFTWDPLMWWKSTGELDWSRSAMSSQCSLTRLREEVVTVQSILLVEQWTHLGTVSIGEGGAGCSNWRCWVTGCCPPDTDKVWRRELLGCQEVKSHHLMVQLSGRVKADGLMDDRMVSQAHSADRFLASGSRLHFKSWHRREGAQM